MGNLFNRPSRFPAAAPRLATPRVLTRNELLARREQLTIEERTVEQRLDQLRAQLDDIGNQLGVAEPAPLRESERDAVLWMINQDRSRRGLPPLAEVPPGPPQPKRGGPIDAAATAKAIVAAGKRARNEPPDE